MFYFAAKISFTFLCIHSLLLPQAGEIIKKASKSSGISESKIRSMARAKGMSDSDIKAEALKRGFISETDVARTNDQGLKLEAVPKIESEKSIDQFSQDTDEVVQDIDEFKVENENSMGAERFQLPHFGYNLFSGDPESFQTANVGSIDPNYNIGPGDEIIIMLWGETQFRQTFNVDREGYIFIVDIGQVFVNGLNL